MKQLLVFFLLSSTLLTNAQSYDDKNKASELCLAYQKTKGNNFMSNKEADNALEKILSVIGAYKNFVLQPCSDIDNAIATSYKGLRYILYDNDFMNKIVSNTNSWSQLFILAHEVGHHINGHSIDVLLAVNDVVEPKTLATRRKQELESDEFAGFILAKLGASLEQTSEAVNLMASNGDDTYSTHPNKVKRLNAIKIGYQKAKANKDYVFVEKSILRTAEEYLYRGIDEFNSKNYKGAIVDFTKAIELNPKLEQAYVRRGDVKNNLNDNYGAKNDYTKAIEINPNNYVAYRRRGKSKHSLNDYYGAISDFTQSLKLNSDYFTYFFRGMTKYKLKDYQGALNDYNKTIELKSDFFGAYVNRGMIKNIFLNDFYGAIGDYTKAIEINANQHQAYFNRGIIKRKLKDYQGAKYDFNKAIENNKNIADIYYGKALTEEDLNDYEEAINDYTKVIELESKDYNAFFRRGICKNSESIKDYYGAIADFTKVIELKPDFYVTFVQRGVSKHLLGDQEGGCNDWRKALSSGEESAQNLLIEYCD
jgi:tetratricopeptide (TPR) repeat protein